MMSKKNSQEILGQASDSCYHYALRKLNVGVASVLIGTTMYVGLAHADTVTTSNESAPIVQAMAQTTVQSVSNNVVTSSDTVQSQLNHSSVNEVSSGVQSSSNQQASNAAQNDSSSIYDQEQQTSSFDVRNAGVNNATLYNDNKVSQESTISGDASNVSMMVTPEWTTGYGMLRAGVDLSFDISHDQFQNLDRVYLGNLTTDKASSAGYRMSMYLNGGQYRDIVDDGVHFGTLLWKGYSQDPINDDTNTGYLLYLVLDKNATSSLIGSKHFSLHLPNELNLNFYTIPKAFCDNGVLSTNITFTIGDKTSDLAHLDLRSFPNYPAESELKSDFDLNNVVSIGFNSNLSRGGINEWGSFPHVDDWNSYVKNGFNLSNLKLRSKLQNAMKISANQGFSVNGGQHTGIFRVFSFWDNGKQSTEGDELSKTIWGGVPTIRMDDNLSLSQLKSFDLYGMAYSYQHDGSVLVYTNIDTNRLLKSVNWDLLRHELDNRSYVINVYSKDPNKALDNTVNAIKTGVFQFENAVYVQPVDVTLPLRLTVQQLDLNTGAAVGQPDVSQTVLATTVAKGQSTVKFHVISSSGVDLVNVKSFTDLPNQNKHVSLTIPSITGYHLVTNPQSVLSTLHLSGTAISASTQASYPAENTIADYYVVMAPDTESVKVNIVDFDEGATLNSYTLLGDYGSVIMPTSDLSTRLKSLLSSGKYDLVANPLTSSMKYSTTNNPITISLKHHIDSTQRHYRVIEDLPDGTKKVIIDLEATLYKDANTDKWQPDAAYLDGDFTKKVLMSDIYKLNVGQQADNYLPNFLKAYIDKVSGYVWNLVDGTAGYQDGLFVGFYNSDERNAGEIYMDLFNGLAKVPSIFPSRDFHIIYTPRSYPVTVNYYDLSGALISSSKSQHLFADSVNVAPSIPANYVLASGQTTHFTVPYNSSDNELDLVVIPRVTVSTDSRTVTRTIQITRPDRSISTVVQHVTFSRPVYKDAVSGAITYDLWTTPSRNFIAYQPETIDGYHIDTVKSQAVLPMDKDLIVQVAYTKLVTSPTYPYIDAAGHSYNVLPAGYHVVVGQNTKSRSTSALIVKDTGIKPADDVQYVTRTVTITLPNGRVRAIKQRVRKGTRFGRVAVPKLRGYKVVVTGDSQELGVTAAEKDIAMSVRFVKM